MKEKPTRVCVCVWGGGGGGWVGGGEILPYLYILENNMLSLIFPKVFC